MAEVLTFETYEAAKQYRTRVKETGRKARVRPKSGKWTVVITEKGEKVPPRKSSKKPLMQLYKPPEMPKMPTMPSPQGLGSPQGMAGGIAAGAPSPRSWGSISDTGRFGSIRDTGKYGRIGPPAREAPPPAPSETPPVSEDAEEQ